VGREALQQQSTLDERLPHEMEVELFEVPDAAVHKLGRPTRRAAGPVPCLDHSHAQSASDSVERAPRPDDSAADYEDVELFLLEGGYRVRTLLRTQFR
jgi:hypothetical protein